MLCIGIIELIVVILYGFMDFREQSALVTQLFGAQTRTRALELF